MADHLLFFTLTSPYTRVCQVAVRQLGLESQVQERKATLREAGNEILDHNPTGKAPTLVTAKGLVISETAGVCAFLDNLAGSDQDSFVDSKTDEQRAFLGVVTGFVDGVSVWVREARRPGDEQSPDIVRQESERAVRCVAWFEKRASELERKPTMSTSLLIAGLDMLAKSRESVSQADTTQLYAWREDAPDLYAWHQTLYGFTSIAETRPPES